MQGLHDRFAKTIVVTDASTTEPSETPVMKRR